jgi:hypothetical protein
VAALTSPNVGYGQFVVDMENSVTGEFHVTVTEEALYTYRELAGLNRKRF